jgi:pimeloyl-ACP methyl ester carboxylesterase
VLNDGDLGPAGSDYWFDPRLGSDKTFVKALGEFAAKTGHPELASVPWALWGHSAGAGWADVMSTLHPERVIAVYYRSGSAFVWTNRPAMYPPVAIPAASYAIPRMCSTGVNEKGLRRILLATYGVYRSQGAPAGFAQDPRTGHECGDSRYFAIPFLDACLAMRLPDKLSNDQTLKPVDLSQAWLAPLGGDTAVPAGDYKGKPEESVWLPNKAVAKAWMEYVKTGAVGDTTPPPPPFDVRLTQNGDQRAEISWDAEADFESGIRNFIVLRDGGELAQVPEKPIGKFGRPLFQSMTYHDTPSQPMPEMRYVDATAKAGEKHRYTVVSVNSLGLKSAPSRESSAAQSQK